MAIRGGNSEFNDRSIALVSTDDDSLLGRRRVPHRAGILGGIAQNNGPFHEGSVGLRQF